jgi:hypothetical protein
MGITAATWVMDLVAMPTASTMAIAQMERVAKYFEGLL